MTGGPVRPALASRGRRPGRVGIGLGLGVVALTLAACTTPRNVLGPTVSRCYRAVAVARLALHREGRFAGVREVAGASLRPVLAGYHPGASGRFDFRASSTLCLVAYRGRFRAADIGSTLQPGPATGRLAVVVVRQRDERVVGTLLLERTSRELDRVFPVH